MTNPANWRKYPISVVADDPGTWPNGRPASGRPLEVLADRARVLSCLLAFYYDKPAIFDEPRLPREVEGAVRKLEADFLRLYDS